MFICLPVGIAVETVPADFARYVANHVLLNTGMGHNECSPVQPKVDRQAVDYARHPFVEARRFKPRLLDRGRKPVR